MHGSGGQRILKSTSTPAPRGACRSSMSIGPSMFRNPYEAPQLAEIAGKGVAGIKERSHLHVLGLLAVALLLAFVVTPGMCVLAWLQGYGPGGMHELQSGYALREMTWVSAVFCPIHILAFLLPKKPWTKMIGYAVSATIVAIVSLGWFMIAAAIAHV